MQNKIRLGQAIDYAASVDVKGGDLVSIGAFVGIAITDIPAGETGACEVEGVFELPKAAVAIAQGAPLYWNGAALTNVKPANGSGFAGSAWVAAGSGDQAVDVRINFGATPVPDVE